DLLGGLDVVFCRRGCSQEGGVLSPYAHLLGDDPGTGWRGDAKIQGGVADGEGYLQARVQLARAWRAGGARLRAWGQAAWQDSPPVDRVWGLGGPRGLLALGPDEGSARRMVWAGLEAELPLTSRWSWRAFAEVGAASDPLGADIGGEADMGGGLLWRCPCLGANLLWRGDVAWRANGGPPRVTVWFGRRG
ncbi:hypothetical protein IIA16_06845, partial [bacterium]|nr:hypothetical protein [bacterium]